MSNSRDADRYVQCLKLVEKCHSQFDVPALTSQQLLSMDRSNVMVVDVRTLPERRLSQIPRSITLNECYEQLRRNPHSTVVTYCTVGYRSGLEAMNIRHYYPQATIYNLDGIIAYTHAVAEKGHPDHPQLENIHTFGSTWDFGPSGVTTTYFRGIELSGRLMQVGWISLYRKIQRVPWLLLRPCSQAVSIIKDRE